MSRCQALPTTAALATVRSLTFNSQTVDATDSDSAGQWRELLAGAGLKHAKLSGAGIFKDAASDALLQSYFFNGAIRAWQIVIPAFGTVQGPFQISSLDFSGKHDGELAFNVALESAGLLTFTAAP